MDFEQIYISSVLETYFGENLRRRWNLKPYSDPNKPSIFLGWYDNNDGNVISNHKSNMVFLWGGGDFQPDRIRFINNKPNTYQIGYGWQKQIYQSLNIPFKEFILPIKDYSDFKPTPLGENIYVYKGIHGNRSDYFKWNEIVKPLMDVFGEERVIYAEHQPIEYIIEHYYNNCFVYVKPNEKGGSTTMWELGYMGRKTITQNQGELPNILEYKDINDIINLVMLESEKIGTIQSNLSDQVHNIFMNSNDWLNISYYE